MTQAIATQAQLREHYPRAVSLIDRKQLSALDRHCRRFVERSPLVFMATADANGACDVSPRGDAPGFVRVLGDHHLAIPDRKGNNRIDALRNIIENPHVGLVFVVPGVNDTLRVNGSAEIVADPELIGSMTVAGKAPATVVVVGVEEAYLHCGRAFKRGQIWDPQHFAARDELPTLSDMLADQTKPNAAERELLAQADQDDLW